MFWDTLLNKENEYLLHCSEFDVISPVKYDPEYLSEHFGLSDTPIKHEYLGDVRKLILHQRE